MYLVCCVCMRARCISSFIHVRPIVYVMHACMQVGMCAYPRKQEEGPHGVLRVVAWLKMGSLNFEGWVFQVSIGNVGIRKP
jgi:hypothetical protein